MQLKKGKVINPAEFERMVRLKLSSLKRSRKWRRITNEEQKDVKTPEEAKEYIKKAASISMAEVRAERVKRNRKDIDAK